MKITTQGDYALKCILRIAEEEGKPVSVEEICRSEEISDDYAQQLLLKLRRKGLVESVRGPGGGYVLKRSPKSVSLFDVVVAMENRPFEVICKRQKSKNILCARSRSCRVKKVWRKINDDTQNFLKRIRLTDLI